MLASHAQIAQVQPPAPHRIGQSDICFIMLALRMWKQGDQMLKVFLGYFVGYIKILRSV